jgi:hypothetical protein
VDIEGNEGKKNMERKEPQNTTKHIPTTKNGNAPKTLEEIATKSE